MMPSSSFLQLADYRRRVAEAYARVRNSQLSLENRWQGYRADQDDLIKNHPQTPLTPEQVKDFTALEYYPYDPGLRFTLPVEPVIDQEIHRIDLREDGLTRLHPFGRISFVIQNQPVALTLFWIQGYGGGIFLPFQDLTNASETYQGVRYLIDTIKGADLGWEGSNLVVDFNFAYNPSCAYNEQWSCPLPPPENSLPVAIEAGELRFE